jgi:hypothetical protein
MLSALFAETVVTGGVGDLLFIPALDLRDHILQVRVFQILPPFSSYER